MKYIIFVTFLFINFYFGKAQQKDSLLISNKNYLESINQLESEKPSFDNLVKLGSIYQQISNYRLAVKTYQKALNIKDDNAVKLKLAISYAKSNQWENAMRIYEKLVQDYPNNLLLKYQLANLYYKNKSFKKSLPLYQELTQKDKNNTTLFYKLASVYRNLKQKEDAIKQYKKVIQIDSTNSNSYYYVAKLYRKLKEIDSTKKYLKKGLLQNRKHILLNQLQAKVAYNTKDYKSVIQTVLQLDSLKKSTPFYKNLKGIAYYHQGDFNKSIEVFTKMIMSRNMQEDTYFYMGLAYQGIKDYANAELFLNTAIYVKRPKIDEEYYRLAMLYKEQNKPKKAIEFLEKSIKESKNANNLYEIALLSDAFYKDKKIALKYYQDFVSRYEGYYPKRTAFALQQISKIKTALFMHKK